MRHLATRRPEDLVSRPGVAALPAGQAELRYRLMIFQRPLAPWRDTLAEALLDAIYTGTGSREEWTGTVYLSVPAWINEEPKPR